jgi:diguanylate cyclase
MKTIIKYELVINEALRSALNYHTPDEQINEFIRFFGRHIGSDRIYIFEDCKERHGTDNTYEWCTQGVVPEIGRLQNVNMDIIKWWYDTFSKGESIIITDIEDIKEEHRMSYDMLKAQNVRNVVACPLRYKDEISGFFGVDNPPKSDYKGLTTFLDMIGTLLISFLKMRNSFIKSNKEAKLSSYSSLSKIYISMHLVDVQTKRYHTVKMTDQIVECLGKDFKKMGEYEIRDDFCGHIKTIAEKMCIESQLQEVLEFVDISTLEERLLEESSITYEFIDKISGWCRSRFIPVDYDENGRLLHVLFCIECIEKEKKRENRLISLAQTDLMTGLCNRGSGEKRITELLKEKTGGLLCLIDCDKFKSINAADALLKEGKDPEQIFVTGNTGIDALHYTVRNDFYHPETEWAKGNRLIAVTAHRRENLGEPMRDMFRAIRRIVEEFTDVKVIYPVHLNPQVRKIADEEFGGCERIHLIEPLDVVEFHNLMKASYLIMTDSGGIQEEAPALGKPVLVMRDTTERPEGVEAGTLKLAGTKTDDIYRECRQLLTEPEIYRKMSEARNPYGDGTASIKIRKILEDIDA